MLVIGGQEYATYEIVCNSIVGATSAHPLVSEYRAIALNGSAAIKIVGIDLTEFIPRNQSYRNCLITLTDSTGKTATGYIWKPDTAEATTNIYTSDFSADEDGFSATQGDVAGNIDSIDGQDNNLRFTCDDTLDYHQIYKSFLTNEKFYRIRLDYFIPNSNSNLDGIKINLGFFGDVQNTTNVWTNIDIKNMAAATIFRIFGNAGGTSIFQDAGGDDVFYIRNVIIDEYTHLGTDAVLIRSTPTGVTQNWASITSGFNWNSINSFVIYRV